MSEKTTSLPPAQARYRVAENCATSATATLPFVVACRPTAAKAEPAAGLRRRAATCQAHQPQNEQGDRRQSTAHQETQDRDGGPHPHPRPHPGRQAHEGETTRLGIPAASELCRIQGQGGRDRGRVRRSRLHQPDVLLVWSAGTAHQCVQQVWFPGARRRQRQSKPCPDWQRGAAAKGGRLLRLTIKPSTLVEGCFPCSLSGTRIRC